jgi:hypothetical protein
LQQNIWQAWSLVFLPTKRLVLLKFDLAFSHGMQLTLLVTGKNE